MTALAEHFVAISNQTLFERLREPRFIESCFVVALDLTPIQERMGAERWTRRKEQVWEHLGRSLERRFQEEDAYQRITETGFITAISRPSRAAGVAVAAHALQDTLHFFLGQAEVEDIKIREVLSLTGNELSCSPLSEDEIRRAAASWVLGGGTGGAEREEPAVRHSPVISFYTPSGRLLTVVIAVQRITKLTADRPAAQRAEPFVHDPLAGKRIRNKERRTLDSADIGAIDAAILTLARGMWEKAPHFGPIMTPISFHTVSRLGARNKFLKDAAVVADETRNYLLAEIIDVAKGTPAGRIAEAVAMAQAFSHGVFVEAADPTWLKAVASGVKLMGITFDAADVPDDQAAALTKRLFTFAEVGRTFARSLIAHSLPSPAFIDICAAAGLSHACVRAEPCSPVVRINDPG